jgi:hypothetical protein
MKPWNDVATTLVVAVALLLCSTVVGAAHDLRGLKQQFKHKKAAIVTAPGKNTERQQNFQTLREIAKASAQSDFDISKHFESRGFAGHPTMVVQGIAIKTSRWPDFRQLTVCFFGGPHTARNNVMSIYSEILAFTTLSAVNVGICDPKRKTDIRVSFGSKEGYWSLVGTASESEPQSAPTMGLQGLGRNAPLDSADKGTVRHEVLHSIGFEHEHQRPDVDCRFKPFREIAKLLGWTVADVRTNFQRMRNSPNLLITTFDRDSEMLYQLDAEYFTDPQSPCMITDANNNLSAVDIATLKLLYPAPGVPLNVRTLQER